MSTGSGSDTVFAGLGNDIVDERSQTGGGEFLAGPVKNVLSLGDGDDIALLNVVSTDFATGETSETFKIDGGKGTDIVYLDNGFTTSQVTVNAKGQIISSGFLGGSSVFADLAGIEQVVNLQSGAVWTIAANGTVTDGRPIVTDGSGSGLSEDLRGNGAANTLIGIGGYDRYFGGGGLYRAVLSGRAEQMSVGTFFNIITEQEGKKGVVMTSGDPDQPASFVASDIEFLKFQNAPGAGDDMTFRFKIVESTSQTGVFSDTNDFIVLAPTAKIATVNALDGQDFIFANGQVGTLDAGDGDDRVMWTMTRRNVEVHRRDRR